MNGAYFLLRIAELEAALRSISALQGPLDYVAVQALSIANAALAD